MKKLIFVLMFILFPFIVNAQCKWEKNEKDAFTGVVKRITKYETMASTFSYRIKFSIGEFVEKMDTSYTLMISVQVMNHLSECFNDESKIMLKSGETIISINLLGGIDCGGILGNYGDLAFEDLDFLRSSKIDMIRIYFVEGYKDFEMKTQERSDYFIKTLKCFE